MICTCISIYICWQTYLYYTYNLSEYIYMYVYIYINIEIQGIHWISLAMDLPSCIQMWAAECCLFRFHSLAMAHQLVWCFSHAMLVYIYIHINNYIYIYIYSLRFLMFWTKHHRIYVYILWKFNFVLVRVQHLKSLVFSSDIYI